jgi:hypothetical protein
MRPDEAAQRATSFILHRMNTTDFPWVHFRCNFPCGSCQRTYAMPGIMGGLLDPLSVGADGVNMMRPTDVRHRIAIEYCQGNGFIIQCPPQAVQTTAFQKVFAQRTSRSPSAHYQVCIIDGCFAS